jgi:hypothetical protein
MRIKVNMRLGFQYRWFIYIMLFSLASCARILNTSTQTVFVKTDNTIKSVFADSTNEILYGWGIFFVDRSKKPLLLRVQTHDSVTKYVAIKSRKANAYWLNLVSPLCLGFIADRKTLAKYAYPDKLYLENSKDKIKVYRVQPIKKGTFCLTFPTPYTNSFRVGTDKGYYESFGFMGLGIGMEYYYRDNQYLSLSAGGAGDFPVPFPAPYDFFGERQNSSTQFISFRNNLILGSFNFGYGIQCSNQSWRISNRAIANFVARRVDNKFLGLSFSSQFRVIKNIGIGLLYQPSLLNINSKPTLEYQHFISMEFIFKLPIVNGKYNF